METIDLGKLNTILKGQRGKRPNQKRILVKQKQVAVDDKPKAI